MAPNLVAAQPVAEPVVAASEVNAVGHDEGLKKRRIVDQTPVDNDGGTPGSRDAAEKHVANAKHALAGETSQRDQLCPTTRFALALNKKLGYYTRAPVSLLTMIVALVGVIVHFRLWAQASISMWLLVYITGVAFIGTTMSVMLHRYFSHSAFATSRAFQAVMAFVSCCAAQRGPVWWASKHIQHHANCDTDEDPHSPVLSGILGCVLFSVGDSEVAWAYVPKRLMLPELLLIDTFHFVPPMLLMAAIAYCSENPLLAVVMRGALPMVFCCLMSNIFNARYHDDEESEMSAQCRAVDRKIDIMANMVGENLHAMHHVQPRLAKRSNYDLPYFFFLLPLLKLGLVWDAQYSDPVIDAEFKAKTLQVRHTKPAMPAKPLPLRVWDVLGCVILEQVWLGAFIFWVVQKLDVI